MQSDELTSKSLALWGGAALLIAIIVIGAVKLTSQGNGNTPDGVVAGLEPISDADWVLGATSSPAVLIEYSDFQCPACAAYHPLIEKVVADYAGKIAFAYRHFPLGQHQQAKPAAYAAEAAGKQGKFWQMTKVLFEGQTEGAGESSAEKTFETYAVRHGLNLEQFRADVKSSETKARVETNYQGGIKAGVNSTPTFYLNGKKLLSPSSYEGFKQYIDAAIPARQSQSDQ